MTEARDFTQTPETGGLSKRIAFTTPSFEDLPTDQPPENFMMDNFTMRPRAMSHHLSSTKIPSRKWLKVRARWWRSLMRLGMKFHGWAPPRPPKPNFTRHIQTDTIPIDLLFYVPADYDLAQKTNSEHRYPMVVNFHGGGFTLGDATDDRYYARSILQHTKAVFISVNYRRAPEHTFPTAVDDGVEALMYLSTHATELRLDPGKTAITGFSAGANLCFTVPFRLTYYTNPKRPRLFAGPGSHVPTPNISRTTSREYVHAFPNEDDKDKDLNPRAAPETIVPKHHVHDHSPADSDYESDEVKERTNSKHIRYPSSLPHPNSDQKNNEDLDHSPMQDSTSNLLPQSSSSPNNDSISKPQRPTLPFRTTTQFSTLNPDRPTNLKVLTIIAFYPLLDWTASRSSKVRNSIKPELTLKKTFTDLFDMSYLPPPDHSGNHVSPYASPALAPDEMISDGLPLRMQLYLCEYDMLLDEGKKFTRKLEDLGKKVDWEVIPKVPHGWDKSPNPFRDQKSIDRVYERAGRNLQSVFEEAEREPRAVRGERIGLGGLK